MSSRCPPSVLCLAGPPGVGKSYLSIYVVNEIAELLNIERKNIYYRNPFCEHWDGLGNENADIVVYDDMYADCLDPNSQTYREIIQLVSITPFYPPFAALEDKGRNIVPKFVIITTNHPYPPYVCDSDALNRRHHLLVYCLKRGNCTPNSSFNHLSFYKIKDPTIVPRIYERNDDKYYFNNFGKHPGYQLSRTLNVYDIIRELVEHHEKEMKIYKSISNSYTAMQK